MRRFLLGAVLALTVAGAASQPGTQPLDLPAITAPALAERYAANARDGSGRQFLALDRTGDGRAVEVVGDLAAADSVIIFVPGTGYGLAQFNDSTAAPGGAARALHARARTLAPGTKVAVIGWLGYDAPEMTDPGVITTLPAAKGAKALRTLVTALLPKRISLVCHSYGTVVCGEAAPALPVTDIIALGSPGMGVAGAADLRTPARVWTAMSSRDDVFCPGVRLGPIGFGADPNLAAFGARIIDGGDGRHTDYLRPGPTLDRITRIALTGRA
ncbi:alpha/beta hydrolase [Nonomuraea sp. NPDC059023]|uniref:alpha/beta hydrolase n=1 Tax=unclassified Nonomuraea TaxID=2593643 RepID=UPI00367FF4A1